MVRKNNCSNCPLPKGLSGEPLCATDAEINSANKTGVNVNIAKCQAAVAKITSQFAGFFKTNKI